MLRILLLSNGHGEDISGALLGKHLLQMGHYVEAMPFVGNGYSYRKIGIRIIGKTQEFSTGGLGYNTLKGRVLELLQGQLFYLLR